MSNAGARRITERVNIVLGVVVLLWLCFILYGIYKSNDEEAAAIPIQPPAAVSPETAEVDPDFVWHLDDFQWTSSEAHLDESKRMLRYIDEYLDTLDAGSLPYHKERAAYLQARMQVLYHIYNLTQYVGIETE